MTTAINTKLNIAVLQIDGQNCFCHPDGSLYVPGAAEDMQRAATFIKTNKEYIKEIYATFDVHSKMQIFHAAWWKDKNGNHPPNEKGKYTIITAQDIIDGKWIPQIEPEWSLKYVQLLEAQEGFLHCIWPDHALMGTWSQLMYEPLVEAIDEWQVNYGSMKALNTLNKGWNPGYEFFGIFAPQIYLPDDSYTHFNSSFVEKLNQHALIYTYGEALSHCFGLSIKQLVDQANKGGYDGEISHQLLSRLVVLTDCSSDIPGFEGAMDPYLEEACEKYGMEMMASTEVNIIEDFDRHVPKMQGQSK